MAVLSVIVLDPSAPCLEKPRSNLTIEKPRSTTPITRSLAPRAVLVRSIDGGP